jgi:RsiW-degrading membrane proteinase PrsW (M82 family)
MDRTTADDGDPQAGPRPKEEPVDFQRMADHIADTIGLERIEGFKAKNFFADIFTKRTSEEVEAHFAWGFPGMVPPLSAVDARWPRPWSFLRILAAGAVLFGFFVVGEQMFHNTNLLPGLILTGSFAAPVAMVVFFYEMNVVRNISVYHLARLFLLGGVASVFLALLIDSLFPIDTLLGAPAAGITEEVAKLVIVITALKLMRLGPKSFLLNGLLIGASVGAGFAAFESAGYAFRALLGGIPGSGALNNIVMRGVLSPFGHIAWTAIAAGALWRVSEANTLSLAILRDARFLRLFGLVVGLHAVWDLGFGLPVLPKYAVLGVIAWVALLSLLQTGLRQVARAQEAEAAPEPRAALASAEAPTGPEPVDPGGLPQPS